MSIILRRGHRLLHVRTLLAQRNAGEQEIHQVRSRSPFDSEWLCKERATPRAPLWEEAREQRVLHREFAPEEMQRRSSSWVSTTGSSATRNSARIWLTSVALKNYVVKWTNWRTKTTRTTSLQKVCTRNNWWIRSNTVGSDTMPVRHRADFKASIVNLATAQTPRRYSSSATMENVMPHLGGTGKNPGGILLNEASPRRPTQPWLIRETCWKVIGILMSRYDSQNSLGASLQFKIR